MAQKTRFVEPYHQASADGETAALLAAAMESTTLINSGTIDGAALRQMDSVSEKSTPQDRAVATLLRAAGLVLASAVIAWGMAKAGATGSVAWALFAALVFGSLSWLYRTDAAVSPLGVERYKAAQYRAIRRAEIASAERIALRKIDLYEKLVRWRNGNRD